MKRIVIVFTTLLLLVACNVDSFNPSTAKTIDRVPTFSSSSTIMSRSALPSSMSTEDVLFTLMTPPITKFEETSDVFKVGDFIEVDLFSNTVTLETSLTNEGFIKFSGVISEIGSDYNNVETGKIEILYDKENSKFSYYSEVLITDPVDEVFDWGSDGHLFVIQEIPFTDIEEDNSFITSFNTLAYMKQDLAGLEVQLVEAGELYSGPGEGDVG